MKKIIIVATMAVCAGCGSIPKGVAPFPVPDNACGQHLIEVHGLDGKLIDASLDRELDAYLQLFEHSLSKRASTIAVAQRLKDKARNNEPLSGEDLKVMNEGVVSHLELREQLYRIAEGHECWLNIPEQTAVQAGMSREQRLRGVMVSLSSALILYDNYLLAISLFEEDDKLRRLLNQPDTGYQKRRAELQKVASEFTSASNRARVRRAIKFYEAEKAAVNPAFFEQPQIQYLELLIEQSPSYASTRAISPFTYLGRRINLLANATEDGVLEVGQEGMNLFSMVFGNAMGLVETRKGKLYGRPEVARNVRANLQAGDILLEKTPFRLTDKLIPGFWGHAAIWIGTEQELRDLGLWDHPLVVKHHSEITEGRLVVEALRSGVEMNSLDHFLNIDDLGIMRRSTDDRQKRIETILLALRQVGKSYDFNFDVETTDRIVCSELVYLVYPEIPWPTAKTLGRATFSPDHVARKGLDGGTLRFVTFYHDGNLVESDAREQVALLMEGPKSAE